jgi:hypothetical protein
MKIQLVRQCQLGQAGQEAQEAQEAQEDQLHQRGLVVHVLPADRVELGRTPSVPAPKLSS